MSPEEASLAVQDVIASLHEGGLNMGQISCLVLDQLILYFEGLSAIRRIVSEME